MSKIRRSRARRPVLSAVCLVAAALVFHGCDDDNAWTLPTENRSPSGDEQAPVVELELPTSGTTVATGDSVLTRFHVSDNLAVGTVELSGFALIGDADLGTQEEVARFESKTVDFGGEVTDTTVSRFLLSTNATGPEATVYLVAVAADEAGNTSADTVVIGLGGPQVGIVAPLDGDQIGAGSQLNVHIAAHDSIDEIRSLRLVSTGALVADTTLDFSPFPASVDTIISLTVPEDAQGELVLQASVLSGTSIAGDSRAVTVTILPLAADNSAPTVTFSVNAPERAELTDSISVAVSATDNTVVDSVGVTLLGIDGAGASADTTVLQARSLGSEATFNFALADLGIVELADTATLFVDVTAYALDTTGNCGASSAEDTEQSLTCVVGPENSRVAGTSGSRVEVLLARGLTIPVTASDDRIADMASDGERIFLSNLSQNRVEVLDLSSNEVQNFRVGSEPWGLALSPDSTRLYVANSGGTNISVIDLTAATLLEREEDRIYTPNIRLYEVPFSRDSIGEGAARRSAIIPASVTEHDYSDRPQFIAQTASDEIYFSTKPTGTAPDGTLRHTSNGSDVEFLVDYADHGVSDVLVIVNALDAALVPGDPNQLYLKSREGVEFTGFIDDIQASLALAGSATYFEYFLDLADLGLQDTTFVAVSGDHETIAFGEGAINPGRIILYDETGAGTAMLTGDTDDLVGNAAERVIGLTLNADGSLGAARGDDAYFFTPDLRLQGVGETGVPTGGISLHPAHRNYPATADPVEVAFVSGVDENGAPYIDVMDTFNFVRRHRIFVRSAVTGPILAVAPTGADADVVLQVYAVTDEGVLRLDLEATDLQ